MYLEQRQHWILTQLEQAGSVGTVGLAEALGVSLDTVRRDLAAMEAAGLLRRTHGGALPAFPVRHRVAAETTAVDSAEKLGEGADDVARVAAGMIGRGETVYIGSAPLNWRLLDHLPAHAFTVVTNSLLVGERLRHRPDIELFLIGGRIRQKGSTVDAMAAAFIRQFRLDKAFVSGSGFSSTFGLSNADADAARYQQAVCESAREVIILMPGERLGREAFARVVPVDAVHCLITDKGASQEECRRLCATGLRVLVAEEGAIAVEALCSVPGDRKGSVSGLAEGSPADKG